MTGPMASLAKMNHAAQGPRDLPRRPRHPRRQRHPAGKPRRPPPRRHGGVLTFEGTDSIQSLIVGREITGLSALA